MNNLEATMLYLKKDMGLSNSTPLYLVLTPGKYYKVFHTPVVYNPQTLQPVDTSYIVVCDDGKTRTVNAKWFLTKYESRDMKLKELGI